MNSPNMADVEFIIDDHTYYAHRLVLCSACDYFRRLFGIAMIVKVESLGECPGWSKKKLEKITQDGVNMGKVEGIRSFLVM